MRSLIHILVVLFIFSVTHARGQAGANYLFRHISHQEGLSNDEVFTLAQDNRGFMWIGTKNGFQRYDGNRFITYRDELSVQNKSLIAVTDIKASMDHQLFMATVAGNKKLDLLTNKVSDFGGEDIYKDTAGKIRYAGIHNDYWMFGFYYIYHYDDSLKKFYCNNYMTTRDEQNRQTWVVNYDYILVFDDNTKRVYTKEYNPIHHPILEMEHTGFHGIRKDSRNNLWLYAWNDKFYKYDSREKKLIAYSLPEIRLAAHDHNKNNPLYVNSIYEDDRNHLWIATCNAGLLEYHYETDKFTSIRSNNKNIYGLQYNYEIFAIFQDRDDNIWLGTDKGINIFNPYHQYFTAIMHNDDEEKTLSKGQITSFLETRNGNLLVGTYGGGITVFDNDWKFIKKINFTGSFESNIVWNLLEREDGKIWVGCQHGYLHIYDPVTGSVSTSVPAAFEKSTIRYMSYDPSGNILFGLHNGKTAIWKKSNNQFLPYSDNEGYFNQVGSGVQYIFFDSRANCWISTWNGLMEFDEEKRKYIGIYYPKKNYANGCLGIEELNDSTLVVGIDNGGFCFFNTKTKTFSFPDVAEKISSHSVHAIKKDSHGNLWFAADYNLYRYNISQNKISSFYTDPGIINSSFELNNFYSLKDGRWVTATNTEAICFNVDTLNMQPNPVLPVEITGLKIFDKRLFVDSLILNNKPLEVSYKQNFLTIEFASLGFSYLRERKYFFQLHGIDQDWVNADGSGEANYTNLPPGHYDFEVRSGESGNKTDITSFKIIISPPFWQTIWFRVGALLLIASFFYWLFRRRVAVIRREGILKQQIAETEMMALRAQMNPHFIFNCINSIDALIQSNDKYLATVYLNKFAKLIRNILDSSKQNTVTLAKDLETLQLYIELEQFRNDNKFSCEIDADAELLQDDYKVPPLIIQPYVENAILHGLRYRSDNKGKLSISVAKENGHLIYIVEDNGVGRHAIKNSDKKDKQSYGIEMSNDRVRLFNRENKASVTITDLHTQQMAAGTRVQVILKIQ